MHSPRPWSPLSRRGCELPCVRRAVAVPLLLPLLRRFVVVWQRAGIDIRVVLVRRLDLATHQDRQVRLVQP
nr:hypothetical protein [Kribbella sindirgiensis]